MPETPGLPSTHTFFNNIISTCNALYLQIIKKYMTTEEHHNISSKFHNAGGVKIFWRGRMPTNFSMEPGLNEAKVAFQFLQTICKEPMDLSTTQSYSNAVISHPSIGGFTSAKRFWLTLRWSDDCPIRNLDLFVFELRVPDIRTVDLDKKVLNENIINFRPFVQVV